MIWVGLFLAMAGYVAFWLSGTSETIMPQLVWSSLAITVIALFMFQPWIYKRLPRILRDVQRFLCGFAGGTSVFLLLTGTWLVGSVILTSLFVARCLYSRKRAERKLHACDGCSELSDEAVCSGFSKQATLIRGFEIKAAEYIESQGLLPPGLG